jgi:four helix bundle protein
MGARHHSELVAWQLASSLRDQVLEILAMPAAERHRRFSEELGDAASSIPRNIAEGFARYTHPDFARFLDFALGSLGEAQTLLNEAIGRRLLGRTRHDELMALSFRVKQTTTRLKQSLSNRKPSKRPRPNASRRQR